ncbi:FMN-dependent NADH-azoreductase [Paucidesulfovibrio gracilis DSM 16080]|uniref:FMN dependent NADH:quinone oxidoreductase n=1 Tax=Paucidesulfovibrio gracilis DSM 16080 TaxID=1121449 RepID=A0A1T4XW87_9BACT|nr:NAD(P)H-dependent oxidoreductase [Paucidesulfovibrio gracilis]SKA93839.1 FMN-dependent NADH-azoreductase [Paucidesulfovibrio gracilis DSM 16080]
MSNILYVKASPRVGRSHSIALADAFLTAYLARNQNDTVAEMDLFQMDLPDLDPVTVQGKYNIMHQLESSEGERQAWKRVEQLIEEFKSADKYVFAVPMWNFSIPYRLKHFIDVVTQPGYTFTVGSNGYEGLLQNRKALVAYASGGDYAPGSPTESFNFQSPYMDLWLGFIGITEVVSAAAAGMLGPNKEASKAKAIKRVQEIAEDF